MQRVPVVDKDHQPLMPTTAARARRWLEAGKAVKRWSDCGQFYVQLTVEPLTRQTQDVVIGVDPGKCFSGIAVQSAKHTLFSAHLTLHFKLVCLRLANRRLMRFTRRSRRINRKVAFHLRAHRPCRFNNRRKGRLSPSIRANRELELRVVKELCHIYPVSAIKYEYLRVDIDLTSGRKNAKPGYSFSPVMNGQKWMLKQLAQFAPTSKVEGWQTARTREHLGLVKNKIDKSKAEFATHAVDGVALACSYFVKFQTYHRLNSDCATWVGAVNVTKAPFFLIRRPAMSRRQLHVTMPTKGGVRGKYGGSVTRYGYRKGDLVRAQIGNKIYTGWVSGDTESKISVSDHNWKRIGQFVTKKVSLLARSTGLIVFEPRL